MFLIYNILGVDTDANILQNYNPTKEILKDSFDSIYSIRGNKAYAYEPSSIKKKGGPRGIAASAHDKINS